MTHYYNLFLIMLIYKMSVISYFIVAIESNIIDKNYQLSKYKDEIITYHWSEKNIILDFLVKEDLCAINNNNDVLWISINPNNIENILSKISIIVDY